MQQFYQGETINVIIRLRTGSSLHTATDLRVVCQKPGASEPTIFDTADDSSAFAQQSDSSYLLSLYLDVDGDWTLTSLVPATQADASASPPITFRVLPNPQIAQGQ